MNDQNDELKHRKRLNERRIEEHGNQCDRNGEECRMPAVKSYAGVDKDRKAFDLYRSSIRDGGETDLPAKHRQPSYEIAEQFLDVPWSEFRYPVILSSS